MGNCCSNSPDEKSSNVEMIDENKKVTDDLDSDGARKRRRAGKTKRKERKGEKN
ncbi:unnamed protein product [Moneuplotes crassus]|uniref:Uncharacterized protein n=1 Tax=Euplotes crassus TaxID=5936 RepID=A0AAD2D6R1_EUPCR|nr:unnamed protein product [Moneuplotes crassus]